MITCNSLVIVSNTIDITTRRGIASLQFRGVILVESYQKCFSKVNHTDDIGSVERAVPYVFELILKTAITITAAGVHVYKLCRPTYGFHDRNEGNSITTDVPVTPVPPVAPIAPVRPLGPFGSIFSSPTDPCGPVNPVGPTAPGGPITPCCPVEPVSPGGPGGPATTIYMFNNNDDNDDDDDDDNSLISDKVTDKNKLAACLWPRCSISVFIMDWKL